MYVLRDLQCSQAEQTNKAHIPFDKTFHILIPHSGIVKILTWGWEEQDQAPRGLAEKYFGSTAGFNIVLLIFNILR